MYSAVIFNLVIPKEERTKNGELLIILKKSGIPIVFRSWANRGYVRSYLIVDFKAKWMALFYPPIFLSAPFSKPNLSWGINFIIPVVIIYANPNVQWIQPGLISLVAPIKHDSDCWHVHTPIFERPDENRKRNRKQIEAY